MNVYGQTKQYLQNRIHGHKNSSQPTALIKHAKQFNHNFNFQNTKILNFEQNQKAREILEMVQIKRNPNSVNDRVEIAGLSKIYHNLI